MARMLSQKIESDKHKPEEQESGENGEQEEATPAAEDKSAGSEDPSATESDITERESKVITTALASETRNIINSDLFGNLGDLEFESKMEDKVEADGRYFLLCHCITFNRVFRPLKSC